MQDHNIVFLWKEHYKAQANWDFKSFLKIKNRSKIWGTWLKIWGSQSTNWDFLSLEKSRNETKIWGNGPKIWGNW